MDKKDIVKGLIKGKSGYRTLKISNQAKEVLNINNLWSFTKEYVSHKFKEYLRSFSIEDACLHGIRRTFGLNLIKQGMPIYQVK